MNPLVSVIIALNCLISLVSGQSASNDAKTSCNPPYSFTSPNICLRDSSKLLACSRRLTNILQDKNCARQKSLWNCVWHQLRSEECKGKFLLVRNQLPKQCHENSNTVYPSATQYGTRGLALWLSCVHAFSSCDQYWSCDSLEAFKACSVSARKLINPSILSTVNRVTTSLEQIHKRLRCLNHSAQAVFPYEFKQCLSTVSLQALNHVAGLAKNDPGITINSSREKGTCFSTEKLEHNLNAFLKACPVYLQKYDQPTFAAIRNIFESVLPESEGFVCNQASTDPDYKPVQMCP